MIGPDIFHYALQFSYSMLQHLACGMHHIPLRISSSTSSLASLLTIFFIQNSNIPRWKKECKIEMKLRIFSHEIYGTWRKLWNSYDDFLLNQEVFVSRVLWKKKNSNTVISIWIRSKLQQDFVPSTLLHTNKIVRNCEELTWCQYSNLNYSILKSIFNLCKRIHCGLSWIA